MILQLCLPFLFLCFLSCFSAFSVVIGVFIIEGVCGLRRKGLDRKNQKHLKGVVHKQIVGSNNQNENQIEVVTYTAVNNRCAIVFQTGGLCFLWRLFSLGGGGGGGGGLESTR